MSTRRARGFAGLMPLVDTLFLLLFALLATAETRADGERRVEEVHVTLPEVVGGADADAEPRTPVRIEVDRDAVVRVAGLEPLAELERLAEVVDRATDGRARDEVVIDLRADESSPYGVTVRILQRLRLAGFGEVRLTALREEATR